MELKGLIKKYRSIKPNPAWQQKSQDALLAYFQEKFPVSPTEKGLFIFKPAFVTAVALLLVFGGAQGVLKAAEDSLPGDVFYPIKRMKENVVLQLSSQAKKPVLIAEIVEKRLKETKSLAEKTKTGDGKTNLLVSQSFQNFQKDLLTLKKEIIVKVQPTESFDLLSDLGSFPVEDNRKIISLIEEKNLDEILATTKENLKNNNLSSALENTLVIEKIISAPTEPTKEETDKVLPEPTMPATETKEPISAETKKLPATGLPVLGSPAAGSLSEIKIKPLETKSTDFKIDLQKETDFLTDVIKE